MTIANQKILIVAGQPKAGTTSLFEWFRRHPQVCGAKLKETRFFLDADYPLPRAIAFNGANLEDYAALFENPDRDVLLEATPDYLYNKTPLQVATLLPNARIVVVVRDPVDRMLSAFQFFRQRGLVPQKMTFDDYVAYQVANPVTTATPVQFRALDHCRVEAYLPAWTDAFGDRLLVIDFARLRADPRGVANEICELVAVDAGFFADFDFSVANKTKASRLPWLTNRYLKTRSAIARRLTRHFYLVPLFRPLNRLIKKLVFSGAAIQSIKPSDATIRMIAASSSAGRKT